MKAALLFIGFIFCMCPKSNAQIELIQNGNFSSLYSNWTVTGNWNISNVYSCYRSSPAYAYAGNASGQAIINETGDLTQTITIPAAATNASFSFYTSKSTDETTTTTIYDHVKVYLLDGAGTQLMEFTPSDISNLNAGSPVTSCDAYAFKSFSIPSSYFGQPLQIDFKVHSDNSKNTMFRIDDVSVTYMPAGGSLYGMDVYALTGNGTITWPQVNASGKSFAYAKATKGNCYTDGQFVNYMTNGNAAGVIMGAYDFSLPEDDAAISEADYFVTVAGAYIGHGHLPPALDLEDPAGSCIVNTQPLSSYFTAAALAQWVQNWCAEVHTLTGVWPVVYTTRCYAAELYPYYQNGTINNNIKLWIADIANPAGSPANTASCVWNGWPWLFHQYSWTGTVSGISGAVDLDVFNGDLNAFNNLVYGCSASGTVTWTGSIDTFWDNPGNWSCGTVPDATTNVIINSGTVVVRSNAFCRTLTVGTGVNFTVKNGFNVTVAH